MNSGVSGELSVLPGTSMTPPVEPPVQYSAGYSLFPESFGLLSEEERKKHYALFTVEQYWEALTGGAGVWEITTKDISWEIVAPFAKSVGAQQHGRSFFVSTSDQLKKVIISPILAQYKANVYVGENPRLQTWKKVQRKNDGKFFTFKVYEGKNISVEKLQNIFIDIDALHSGLATPQELQRAISVAEKIDQKMVNEFNAGRCIALISGNGVQLIYSLDQPLTWPELQYEVKEHDVVYYENEEFTRAKEITKQVIAKVLQGIEVENEEKIAKIDNTWDIRRVGRLPFTRNFKYAQEDGTYRWCGIAAIRKESNVGFTQKLLSKFGKKQKPVFNTSDATYSIPIQKLRNDPLVQLLLSERLPEGGRNAYLELSLGLLLRDSGIDVNDVSDLIADINSVQQKKVNVVCYLPHTAHFNPNVVNNWCGMFQRLPVYPLFENKPLIKNDVAMWKATEVLDVETSKRILGNHEDVTLLNNLTEHNDILKFFEEVRQKYFMSAQLVKCALRCVLTDKTFTYYETYWFPILWGSRSK